MEALEWKYGKQKSALAMEVRDVEENGLRPKCLLQERLSHDPVKLTPRLPTAAASWRLLIRQSWRDAV